MNTTAVQSIFIGLRPAIVVLYSTWINHTSY
jgi:hypothetical protein